MSPRRRACGRFFNAGMGDTPIPDQMMYRMMMKVIMVTGEANGFYAVLHVIVITGR
ncbi:hypothetical protein P8853_06195 [Bacillus haynesii]|uniref:hypothetical protein n=1 Tax=Bacillus haynesii TaxID=1925021 RepID=UPI0015F62A26|nr:hypothetical protein [Bacillus haynesii]MCY8668943.1 hypothetical protein [Bacillus haynesii]MEC0553042.1 hypothetical protein [Bacillus haynesii]